MLAVSPSWKRVSINRKSSQSCAVNAATPAHRPHVGFWECAGVFIPERNRKASKKGSAIQTAEKTHRANPPVDSEDASQKSRNNQ